MISTPPKELPTNSERTPETGRVTVQDLLRRHASAYIDAHRGLPWEEADALLAMSICKTLRCGGRVHSCKECGHRQASFLSCGNKLCPKCGREDKAKWMANRKALYPPDVRFFHAVPKPPSDLASLAWGDNKRIVLDILFAATAATLKRVAEERLGAGIGFTSVVQTAAGDLFYDPHVHMIGPAVGLSADRSRVKWFRNDTFPERLLERVFREEMIERLVAVHPKLKFYGKQAHLKDAQELRKHLENPSLEWRFWFEIKATNETLTLIRYVGRVIATGPISNEQIIDHTNGKVTLESEEWNDGKRKRVKKTWTLSVPEFITRLLRHALPKRFKQSRDYGFLANGRGQREKITALCRLLNRPLPTKLSGGRDVQKDAGEREATKCRKCGSETKKVDEWQRGELPRLRFWGTEGINGNVNVPVPPLEVFQSPPKMDRGSSLPPSHAPPFSTEVA